MMRWKAWSLLFDIAKAIANVGIIGIVWATVKYKNRIPCILKGHDYQGKYEVTKFISGENHKYVTRCTRCGKILR